MSWLSQLIFGNEPAQTQTERDYLTSTGSAGAAAGQAQSRYLTDSSSFDPRTAYQDYARGAYGDFQKNLGRSLRDLGGRSVGQGRFNSGFFDEDQGEVVRNLGSDFSNQLAQGALAASGQRLGQIGQEGQYALGQSGMYNDLLSGQLDRETAKENAKRAARSDFWSGLGKVGTSWAMSHL